MKSTYFKKETPYPRIAPKYTMMQNKGKMKVPQALGTSVLYVLFSDALRLDETAQNHLSTVALVGKQEPAVRRCSSK